MIGNTIENLLRDIEMNRDINIATENATEPEPPQQTQTQPIVDPFPGQILSTNDYCTIIKFPKFYKVYLKNEIDETTNYLDLIKFFNKFTEEDIVEVNLVDSPGGYVNSGMLILNAMVNTSATVITNVKGYAYSMAAVIWGYGDIIKIVNGVVMFHNMSTFIWGNVNKIKNITENQNEIFVNCLSPIVEKGILTQEEYNDIMNNNKDKFLHYTLLKDRANAYNDTKSDILMKINDLFTV